MGHHEGFKKFILGFENIFQNYLISANWQAGKLRQKCVSRQW